MLDKQYAKVKYIDFAEYERIIVLSDIHGDYDGFCGLLEQVRFAKKDALIIVGDILEKGNQSLKLLRAVMQYMENGNVFMAAGNNDIIFSQWYEDDITEEEVLWYVNSRKNNNSVLIEMANELQMEYKTAEEIRALKIAIKTAFQKELQFLQELPDILESPIVTFVHAGIQPGDLNKQPYSYCLTAPAFADQTHRFEKTVIVGHWPVSNYRDDIINANPYINEKTNVISMDGGNSMKLWRQINYLILNKDGNILQTGYYDNLPKVRALENQAETQKPIALTFPNTMIKIKNQSEKSSLCYVPHIDQELIVDNEHIYEYKRKMYCYDFTTYDLPVTSGDVLSLCEKTENGILAKRNGVVGHYKGKYEML